MKYVSKNAGLLAEAFKEEKVKDGDVVKIIEDSYENFNERTQTTFLNVKVELADGTHKLASISGNFGADNFAELWGDDTEKWIGHSARITVLTAKSGNPYMVLRGIAGDPVKVGGELTPEQIAEIQALRDRESAGRIANEDSVNPVDLPF
ncbi:MAG: hypothetical protein U1D31_03360 [Patescibacteria group bacterium]|nr:hypothetical protein [Patescibacteria group bacterium]